MNDWPDITNGLFEILGSAFVFMSIRRLWIDKVVKGVSFWTPAFFASWGYWNIFYYAQLDQWWSWFGGLGVMTMNTVWVAQLLYYRRYPGGVSS